VRIIEIDRDQKRIALSLDAVTAEEQEKWMHERMDARREANGESPSQQMTGSVESYAYEV
jgi:ribosomal protein S1